MRFHAALPALLLTILAAPPPASADIYQHRAYPNGDCAISVDVADDWILIAAPSPDTAGLENALGKVLPTATLARVQPLVPGRWALEISGASASELRRFGESLVHAEIASAFWPAWARSSGRGFFDDTVAVAIDDRAALKRLDAAGVELVGPSTVAGLYRARALDGDAIAAAWRVGRIPGVRWAEPDLIRDAVPMAIADDPDFGAQWHLQSPDGAGSVDATTAWDTTKGDPEIVVAIFDTGFDTDHPDLEPNVVGGFDALGNDDDPEAECSQSQDGRAEAAGCPDNAPYRESHGTAVAGTAAGRGDNQILGAGVCPLCSLYLVRLIGQGGFRSLSNAEAFDRAANDGVDVINNSWGPSITRFFPLGQAEQEVFDRISTSARDGKGIVNLFAAGNDFFTPATANPYASHPGVITVAASSRVDDFACYSNYGSVIAIAAPSQGCFGDEPGIVTADYAGQDGYSRTDLTTDFGGTSAASPVAAGVAGLVLSANPELTAQQVRLILQASAEKIRADKHDWADLLGGTDLAEEFDYDEFGFSRGFGYGRVDAARAVALALEPPATAGPCGEGCAQCIGDRCVPACEDDATCPGASRCVELDAGGKGCVVPAPAATDPGQPCAAGCDTCVVTANTDFEESEICTNHCETDEDCAFGFDCRTLDPAAPRACVPGNQECGLPYNDVRCQSQVAIEVDGERVCSCDCFDDGPGGCPDGFMCSYVSCRWGRGALICEPVQRQNDSNYLPHCVPDPDYREPVPCTAHTDCEGGLFCIDGTCEADRQEGGCDTCAACNFEADCLGDEKCLEVSGQRRCVQPCSTADEVSNCPADTLCTSVPRQDGQFCVNPDFGESGYCPDDYRCLEEGRCWFDDDCAEGGACVDNGCVYPEPDMALAPDAGEADAGVADLGVEADSGEMVVMGSGGGDDGCSVSGPGRSSGWPVVALVVGLVGVLRRR